MRWRETSPNASNWKKKKRVESDRFRLLEIIESASDAIIAKDLNGFVQSWNSGAENLFGYELAKCHADQDAISDMIRLLRQGESIAHYGAKLIAKDGSIKDVAIYSIAFHENEGKFHTRCFTIQLSPDL